MAALWPTKRPIGCISKALLIVDDLSNSHGDEFGAISFLTLISEEEMERRPLETLETIASAPHNLKPRLSLDNKPSPSTKQTQTHNQTILLFGTGPFILC